MKKVLLSAALLLVASFAFAQEKTVKEAKKIASAVQPDFAKAEELINQALTNPETKDLSKAEELIDKTSNKGSGRNLERSRLHPEEKKREGNGERLPEKALRHSSGLQQRTEHVPVLLQMWWTGPDSQRKG